MTNVSSMILCAASGLALLGSHTALAQTTTAPTTTAPGTAPATTAPTMPATAAAPAAGMAVKDAAGAAVGTVTSVSDGFVVVKTDKHEVKLPAASFTPANGALLYGMTQAQLNADIEQQIAAAQAQFKTGATVRGSGGEDVGTITALDADSVTLKLVSGKSVRVPRNGIAPAENGLAIGMTAAQLDAAAGPATTAASTKTGKAAPAKKAVKKKRK